MSKIKEVQTKEGRKHELEMADSMESTRPRVVRTADGHTKRPPVRDSFVKYHEQFTRLAYEPHVAAIYKRVMEGCHASYEVWKIRTDKHGQEIVPGASQFGTYGWTESNEEQAREKYRSLLEMARSRSPKAMPAGGGHIGGPPPFPPLFQAADVEWGGQ